MPAIRPPIDSKDPNSRWLKDFWRMYSSADAKVVRISDFGGGAGASVADNDSAIIRAVESLPSNSLSAHTGVIDFGYGELSYSVSLPLYSCLRYRGDFIGRTILTYTGTAEAFETTDGTACFFMSVIDLWLKGNADATCGIRVGHPGSDGGGENVGYAELRNLYITGFTKTDAKALWLDNPSCVTADNVTAEDIDDGYGLVITADGVNTGVFSFNNCTFGPNKSTKIGLLIESNSNAIDAISFNGCGWSSSTQCVQITTGAAISFDGCHFETNQAIKLISITKGAVSFDSCHAGGGTAATGVFDLPESTSSRRIKVDNLDIASFAAGASIFTVDPDSTDTKVTLGLWQYYGNLPSVVTGDTGDPPQVLVNKYDMAIHGGQLYGTMPHGTLANRPTGSIPQGFVYYANDLGGATVNGLPIRWNGSAWQIMHMWVQNNVADGGTITHNMGVTPSSVVVTGSVAGEICSVPTASIGATTFVVDIKKRVDGSAGTTQTVFFAAFGLL